MKKIFLNITIIILILMILFPSIVNANFMIFSATKMNIEVQNINEKIKNVWLVIYDENCNVEDAYKNSNMDFSKASFLEAYPNSEYKYCATFSDEVEPFTEENYVFNDKYDKRNYIVDKSISYDYIYGRLSFGDGSKGKYKNVEELIKDGFFDSDEKEKNEIRNGNIICKRTIFYSAKRLVQIKEISVNEIKDAVLKYSISDFSKLEKYREIDVNAGFALRFENINGEFKTLVLGSNDMMQDSHDKNKPDQAKLEKNIILDYSTNKTVSDNSFISNSENVNNYIYIIGAIIITILVELIIARIMKIKATKVIIIVNIITQSLLHAFTYIVIPIIFNKIVFDIFNIVIMLEILILLMEFAIYKKKIKEQSTKKLILYSFLANLISFSISFFIRFI